MLLFCDEYIAEVLVAVLRLFSLWAFLTDFEGF